ncbi:MAG: single-stranded DNA-binding protein [Alphaproteobacteria bacterium]|nr:single-stranded DNA-binding protein [Alphaproteobacteria bacterium]
MNVLIFSGNLGRDAELRVTQNGTPVLSFAVPMKSGYGEREKTDWVDCAIFGKRASEGLANAMTKGTPVVVSGECSLDTFQGNDGPKSKIKVNVHDVTLMGRAPQQQPTGAPQVPTSGSGGGVGSDLDDELIPF